MKVIQSQNINGHISTSLESFTKYIGKYKPPNSVYNVDEEKDISKNQVLMLLKKSNKYYLRKW